jgi:CubicO group peptidase (beta-lactamase class C family)
MPNLEACRRHLVGFTFALAALSVAASPARAQPDGAAGWPTLDQVDSANGFRADGLEALDERLQKFVSDGHVIGLQALLVKDGQVAQYGQYGVRDVETATPVQPGTLYRIYSMTKPITGVALMQLYEEGKFDLDDPVTQHIPEFEALKVLAGEHEDGTPILKELSRPATMRELMSHSAGFAYGLGGEDYANAQFREQNVLKSPDSQTFIDKVAGIPLLHEPGKVWYYSVAVDIQGYLVEKFSGMTLGEYLEKNIFSPLGMDDTGFYVPAAEYDRLSDITYYASEVERFVPFYSENVQFRQSTIAFESGGGGLVSTIDDYARFCQMMLNGGTLEGHRVLEEDTVTLMRTNQLPPNAGVEFDGTQRSAFTPKRRDFGIDFAIISDPVAMDSPAGTGTYYWGGAAGTWFWIDPENDLFFIGMIQRFGALPGEPAGFREESMRLVYEALEE